MAQPTAKDVAEWMLKELASKDQLYQDQVAYDIEDKFGGAFTYVNDNGNPAIGKDVLAEFKKLTGDKVVWVQTERYWRAREPGDEPGRKQTY